MKRYSGGKFVKWPPADWDLGSGNASSRWNVEESIPEARDVETTVDLDPERRDVEDILNLECAPDGPPSAIAIPWLEKTTSVPGGSQKSSGNMEVVEPADFSDRMTAIEKALTTIATALADKGKVDHNPAVDTSWSAAPAPSNSANPFGMVRVDSLPQFPKNVPLGMMWETFTTYLEKFNISLSLYHVNESAQKAKLLYLAMGDDLQEIVRSNELRPSIQDPECYENMIKNMASYFRSMTDASAEHDAFGEMKQESNESVMKFYARLRSKVNACGYHASDENRFVRSQFLKGMRNQDLAEHARIHNHALGDLIHNAHRAENLASKKKEALIKEDQLREMLPRESFAVESRDVRTRGQDSHGRVQVSRGRVQVSRERERPSRRYGQGTSDTGDYSRRNSRGYERDSRESRGQGLRGRDVRRYEGSQSWRISSAKRRACPNCNNNHGERDSCQASDKKCWKCNEIGHFASVCQSSSSKRFARQIELNSSNDQV